MKNPILLLLLGTGFLVGMSFWKLANGQSQQDARDTRSRADFVFHEKVLEKRLEVRPASLLRIDVPDIDVTIEPGADERMDLEVEVAGTDASWARKYYEAMKLEIAQDGRSVTISARSPHALKEYWKSGQRTEVRLHVRGPASLDARVSTEDGVIAIKGLEGTLALRTEDGRIELSKISGPALTVETSDGPVRASAVSSASTTIQASDAAIDVDVIGGLLKASTSGGEMRVRLQAPRDVLLETQEGDISIVAPASLRADLDLSGSRLEMGKDFRVEGQVTAQRAKGRLNGGGSRLLGHSSEGKITLAQ